METKRVLGLCGRNGSGKSTVAQLLTKRDTPKLISRTIPQEDIVRWMENILFMPKPGTLKPFLPFPMDKKESYTAWEQDFHEPSSASWIEISFALPLKQVVSVIFDCDFHMLLGLTPEARHERETRIIWEGKTGRQLLEYFGTDVLRQKYDKDIWLKIAHQTITKKISCNAVISDMRFQNEIEYFKGYPLAVIYRGDIGSLFPTLEECQKEHPSKWEFLLHFKSNPLAFIVGNNGTKEELLANILEYVRRHGQSIRVQGSPNLAKRMN
jgi:hypothetical protein